MAHLAPGLCFILTIQLLFSPPAFGDDKILRSEFAPDEFMNSTVFLVARLDASRVNINSVAEWGHRIARESSLTDEQSDQVQRYLRIANRWRDWLSAFKQRGGRYIYQYSGPPNIRDSGTYWAFPVAEKQNIEPMRAWMKESAGPVPSGIVNNDPNQIVIRNETVMFASTFQQGAFSVPRGPQRLWLHDGFNEVKDAPLSIVYVQNDILWDAFGIKKNATPLRDIPWFAAGITFDPEPRMRVVALVDDKRTPVEAQKWIVEELFVMTQALKLSKDDANQVISLLTPVISDRKFVIDLDSRSLSSLAHILLAPTLRTLGEWQPSKN